MSNAVSRFVTLVLFGALSVFSTRAQARAAPPPNEKTLSPYFLIENGDPKVDRLPLESTRVEVSVSNVIADVSVTQIYKNDGQRAISAKYVFPASTRAAVHGMRMTIGEQVIEAKIAEKQQAEKTFEAAKKSGKSAALLEEDRPNVFSVSVANVMPSDRIEVNLRYSELLVPSEGVYEFVYPTVVGPRYSNQLESTAPKSSAFVKSPYLAEGSEPASSFELTATLASGIPIAEAMSPSHKVNLKWQNPTLLGVALDSSEQRGNNRDFSLRYRLTGAAIQSGLSLYDAGDEKFFLLQVEPPARVTNDEMPPREYVFVVDVSGSMVGFPLDTAKELLRDLVGGLRPIDSFNVILFSGDSQLLSPKSLPATAENLKNAVALIDAQRGGGGTELLPALTRALALPSQAGISRSFVVVTDGYVEIDKPTMDYVRNHLGQANVFSFGIGSSVNRYLMEGLARAGLGEAFIVTDPTQAKPIAQRFRDYVSSPVLANVHVAYQGFDAYDVEPRAIPDVLAERPVVVFGKWRGNANGSITLTGVGGKGAYAKKFDVAAAPARPEDRALRQLWARTRIANISDFGFGELGDQEKKQVTALGLRYSLLTQYTSFVAVTKTVRNYSGPAREVTEPLPLPAGVSATAVGAGFQNAAEPELWLLLSLLAGFSAVGFWSKRRALARAA